MNEELIDWLRSGPAWVRFAVDRQLAGGKPDPAEALADPALAAVLRRVTDPETGLPAVVREEAAYNGTAYTDLFFLADTGLTVDECGLQPAAEAVFSLQGEDGTFTTHPEYRATYLCISALLMGALARMGLEDDPRIRRYADTARARVRNDGGWHCSHRRAPGEAQEDSPSCPMANLNLLYFLGALPDTGGDLIPAGAGDLLLEHWRRRDEHWRPYGFGIGRRFRRARYPEMKYGLLRVLDVLAPLPGIADRPAFREMRDYLRQEAPDGRIVPASVSRSYGEFDFGQKKEPSRWLSFLVARIDRRAVVTGKTA